MTRVAHVRPYTREGHHVSGYTRTVRDRLDAVSRPFSADRNPSSAEHKAALQKFVRALSDDELKEAYDSYGPGSAAGNAFESVKVGALSTEIGRRRAVLQRQANKSEREQKAQTARDKLATQITSWPHDTATKEQFEKMHPRIKALFYPVSEGAYERKRAPSGNLREGYQLYAARLKAKKTGDTVAYDRLRRRLGMSDATQSSLSLSQKMRDDKVISDRIDEILLSAKDVTPADRKKLSGLLKHYAKKPHPFAACVRDNRKRFGPGTEAVCATLKDIIRGNTHWRGKGNKNDHGVAKGILSDTQLVSLMLAIAEEELWLSPYEQPGAPTMGANGTGMPPDANWRLAEPGGPNCGGCVHFADDSCALYNAPTDAGHVSDGYEAAVTNASENVEKEAALLSQVHHCEYIMAGGERLNLDGEHDDRGVWKTILRTGTWKTRPGPGGAVLDKPLHVKLSGKAKAGNVVLEDLYEAFKDRAVEHVTVPLSHEDKTHENTGYVRELKIEEDVERPGHHKLMAKIHFTEPDIEQKAINGSIANTSVGVNFGYTRKRDGKKYPMVLGHVALTNKPWIDGMEPFGQLAASDEQQEGRLYASFDMNDSHQGGDKMGNEDKDGAVADVNLSDAIEAEFGMTAEEIKETLRRSEDQGTRLRMSEVKAQKSEWSAAGVPPAVIEVAEQIMLADDGGTALLLSEDGAEATLTASEIVQRIVAKVPTLDLSEQRTDEEASKTGKPKPNSDGELKLSHDLKVKVSELELDNPSMTDEDIMAKAKAELGLNDEQ